MTYLVRRCATGTAIVPARARTAQARWSAGTLRGTARAIEGELALCRGLSAPQIAAAAAVATAHERGRPDTFWQGDAFQVHQHIAVVGGQLVTSATAEIATHAPCWSPLFTPWCLNRTSVPEAAQIDTHLRAASAAPPLRDWLPIAAEAIQCDVRSMITRMNCARSYEAGWTQRRHDFHLDGTLLLLGARVARILNLAWMLDLPKVAHQTMYAMYDYVRGVQRALTHDEWFMRALFDTHTLDSDALLGLGAFAEHTGFLLFVSGGAPYQVTAMLEAASERYLEAEAAEPEKPADNVVAFSRNAIMQARARLREAIVPLHQMEHERVDSGTLALQAWVRQQHERRARDDSPTLSITTPTLSARTARLKHRT